MATAYSSEDRLVCPVCLSQFDRPRSLPCLHTFCTSCLRAHIETSAQRNVLLSFPCPVCRADTKPPKPFASRDKWVEQFPVNYWILSAIEDQQSRDREHVMYCNHHSDMKITLFCSDHERLCCPMCVATDHRKCDDVVDTDSVINAKDLAQEKDIVIRMIGQLQSHIGTVAEQTSRAQERLRSKKVSIDQVIGENVDSAVDRIKTGQNKLLSELEDFYNGIMVKIKENKAFCENGAEICEETSELLDDIDVTEPTKFNVMKVMKAKEKLSEKISKRTNGDETLAADPLYVTINEEIRRVQNIESVGKVMYGGQDDVGEEENSATGTVGTSQNIESPVHNVDDNSDSELHVPKMNNRASQLSMESNFHFVNMINTASASSGLSWITSAVSMKHKTFVVCDHKSSSIKLIKDGSSVFEYYCQQPWGVARLSNTQIAVSYPTERNIQIFEVRCDITSVRLRILRKFTFLAQPVRHSHGFSSDDPCFGICFTRSLLVAACEDCVQTYTLNGRMVQKIEQYGANDNQFRRVVSVAYCYNQNMIYACDEIRNCVVALHVDMVYIDGLARFVYTHPDLRCPQGVATGPNREVYVTGFVSRNIHIISPEGEGLRIVDVGQQPWTVCLDTRKPRMLLSYYPGPGNSGACSLYDIKRRN